MAYSDRALAFATASPLLTSTRPLSTKGGPLCGR